MHSKNNLIKAIGFIFLSSVLINLLWSIAVRAQVRISPMVIETEAKRNQAEGVINITNITNKPFRARVYVQPFTYHRDTGFQVLSSSRTDLTPYLQFSPAELTVPPGTTRRIRLVSQLPPSLPDGEYRVVVFTENLQEIRSSDQNGNGINVRTKIGSTFYVRKGNILPHISIKSASFDAKTNQIKLLVSNIGEASVHPKTNWTLKRNGKVISNGNVEPTAIIEQGERYILLNLESQIQSPKLTPDNYELTGNVFWGDNDKNSIPFNFNLIVPN